MRTKDPRNIEFKACMQLAQDYICYAKTAAHVKGKMSPRLFEKLDAIEKELIHLELEEDI